MPDANRLQSFLVDLVSDPDKWERLRKEPRKVLAQADLSDDDRRLLTEGPIEELRRRVGAEADWFGFVLIW